MNRVNTGLSDNALRTNRATLQVLCNLSATISEVLSLQSFDTKVTFPGLAIPPILSQPFPSSLYPQKSVASDAPTRSGSLGLFAVGRTERAGHLASRRHPHRVDHSSIGRARLFKTSHSCHATGSGTLPGSGSASHRSAAPRSTRTALRRLAVSPSPQKTTSLFPEKRGRRKPERKFAHGELSRGKVSWDLLPAYAMTRGNFLSGVKAMSPQEQAEMLFYEFALRAQREEEAAYQRYRSFIKASEEIQDARFEFPHQAGLPVLLNHEVRRVCAIVDGAR